MADDEQLEVEETTEGVVKKSRWPAIAALVLGVGAGVPAGLVGVGPMVSQRLNARPAHAETAEPETKPTFTIENLVLNPAGTEGTRFLMVTVVAELDSKSVADELASQTVAARDDLSELLASKTVEELSQVNDRGQLKEQLRAHLQALVKDGHVLRVYLPTFVIQ